MRIEHLRKAIQDMTPDELLEHIRTIRHERKIVSGATVAKKKRAVNNKATESATALFAKLSPEQREALLKELEGGD